MSEGREAPVRHITPYRWFEAIVHYDGKDRIVQVEALDEARAVIVLWDLVTDPRDIRSIKEMVDGPRQYTGRNPDPGT